MNLKQYKSFKKAGEDWLPEIPSHWDVAPLWSLFARHKLTGFANEQLLSVYRDYGVIPKKSRKDNFNKASEDLSAYQLVDVDDLVINKMKAWQGSVAISKERGIVSPAYHVYAPLHDEHPKYLHYLFRSKEYIVGYLANSKGIRVNQWDLEPQQHSRMKVLLPTKTEQQKIAQFLDYETAKIDSLIDEQKRLIELLKEKRQAVISHAVTKGLNPNAPMKDSGVEWLGEVPEHWTIGKLKHLVSSVSNGTTATQIEYNQNALTVTRIETISSGQINFDKVGYIEKTKNIEPFLLQKGDILFSHINSLAMIGNVAIYDENQPLVHGMNLLRLQPERSVVNSYWLVYFLKSKTVRQVVESRAKPAINQASISTGSIKELSMPLLSLDEQTQIARYLNYETAKIDVLVDHTKKSIELMKERRSALISAAVTGKIDVRDWQPPAGSDTVDSNASVQTERHYG